MPELPEVETTRRGITPHITGHAIDNLEVRESRLRWPVPKTLATTLKNQILQQIDRRAKYLLFRFTNGILILHLGMSGSLRICNTSTALKKHDHLIFTFANKQQLRFHDPRRFGSVHWITDKPEQHQLLKNLGPEPLSPEFNADYLFNCSRKRKVAIKNFIMNSQIVVGVGNIYANEALFLAGIRPTRASGNVSKARFSALVQSIKTVLKKSIQQGGTTLRDFVREDGQPGYFKQQLNVYDRTNQPCKHCGKTIKHIVLGQRASYYCSGCQK